MSRFAWRSTALTTISGNHLYQLSKIHGPLPAPWMRSSDAGCFIIAFQTAVVTIPGQEKVFSLGFGSGVAAGRARVPRRRYPAPPNLWMLRPACRRSPCVQSIGELPSRPEEVQQFVTGPHGRYRRAHHQDPRVMCFRSPLLRPPMPGRVQQDEVFGIMRA